MINEFVAVANKTLSVALQAVLCLAAGFICVALAYAWFTVCLTLVATIGVFMTSIAFFAPIILGAVFAVFYFKRK